MTCLRIVEVSRTDGADNMFTSERNSSSVKSRIKRDNAFTFRRKISYLSCGWCFPLWCLFVLLCYFVFIPVLCLFIVYAI